MTGICIVKVQPPLFSTDRNALPLIYGKGRIFPAFQNIDQKTIEAIDKDPKGYFLANWDAVNKLWIIGERTDDQSW
jgi:hypothetical protein